MDENHDDEEIIEIDENNNNADNQISSANHKIGNNHDTLFDNTLETHFVFEDSNYTYQKKEKSNKPIAIDEYSTIYGVTPFSEFDEKGRSIPKGPGITPFDLDPEDSKE